MKKFEIIIINFNTRKLTAECINSIITTSDVTNITVVDNASDDDSIPFIRDNYPQVKIISNSENLGYAAAINKAVSGSNNSYFMISNSDVVFHQNTIETLYKQISQDSIIGVLGCRQLYPDGSWQYSSGNYPSLSEILKEIFFISPILRKFEKSKNGDIEVEYVDGALMCFSKENFDLVGGFDEDYFFYTEEADFCFRLTQKGRKCIINNEYNITHIRGGSADNTKKIKSYTMMNNSKLKFIRKHFGEFSAVLYSLLLKLLGFKLVLLHLPISSLLDKKNDYVPFLISTFKINKHAK